MIELDLQQIQTRCLCMAKEFDKICTDHNIPYYMLGGTMLGAIRHKGFIPWDDDMDFGVSYEHFDIVVHLLKENLKSPYKCITYLDSDSIIFPYIKIVDTSTVISEYNTDRIKEDSIGVNIDLFPLFSCNIGDKMAIKARKYVDICGIIYADTLHNSFIRRNIKLILKWLCPYSPSWFVGKSMEYAKRIRSGRMLANIYGRWRDKETVPIEWYGDSPRFQFDNYYFRGIEQYDKYLSQLYGDYMKLPEKSKRVLHGGKVFSVPDC